MATALTIAGSDSGGGAGLQADGRVFSRLGVFGTTVVTAVTAQNLRAVTAVHALPAEQVIAQLDAVLEGFDVGALKTGMLATAATIRALAHRLQDDAPPRVVDPVMIATSGARLLEPDGVAAYVALCRGATLVTPNIDEGATLLGRPLDRNSLSAEAQRLRDRLGAAVLLKGGHVEGDPIDTLATLDGSTEAWTHARVREVNTHGTGCLLSAAITAGLADGRPLVESVQDGLAFVHDALERGRGATPPLAAIERARSEHSALRRIA
jgi:hydroxymethylpyrimidine/phosphomethylpyrimidine kinase